MRNRKFRPDVDVEEYQGPYAPYDIIKEGSIALVVVLILTLAFAVFFGSPDEKQVTVRQWAQTQPLDFASTALSELNGTSTSAGYGPPYNTASPGTNLGPLALQRWMGMRIPIDSAQDFVLAPLSTISDQPQIGADLAIWYSAAPSETSRWLTNYGASTLSYVNGKVVSSATNAGPLPYLIDRLTEMARMGGLDQALIAGSGFYSMDYTKPLLFLSDGGYFAGLGAHQHLGGNQWGMMNETGQYPGQAWLWLYTFWYQVPPYNASSNGDVLVWGTMMLLTGALIFVPFIPGLRSIPRISRVYRIIWREHYQSLK